MNTSKALTPQQIKTLLGRDLNDILPHISNFIDKIVSENGSASDVVFSEIIDPEEISKALMPLRKNIMLDFSSIRSNHDNYRSFFDSTKNAQCSAILAEQSVRGAKYSYKDATIKNLYLPAVQDNDEDLIHFLRSNKLVTKQDLNSYAKKVENFFDIKTKVANQDLVALFGIFSPDIFHLPNDGVYKSSPTYRVLNNALRLIDMDDLSTQENRNKYANLDYNPEVVISEFLESNISLTHNEKMLLNLVVSVVNNWSSKDNKDHYISTHALIFSLVSNLIQSNAALCIVLAKINRTNTRLCGLSFPLRDITFGETYILQDNFGLKLFKLINPFDQYTKNNQAGSLPALEDYFKTLIVKSDAIDEIITTLTLNESELDDIKRRFFSKLTVKFARSTVNKDFKTLLQELVEKTPSAQCDETTIKFLKLMEEWYGLLEEAERVTVSETVDIDLEFVNNIKAAVVAIKESSKISDEILSLEEQLDDAYAQKDYSKIISVAEALKNYCFSESLHDLAIQIEPTIRSLLSMQVLEGDSIIFRNNNETKTNSNIDFEKKYKQLVKANRKQEADSLKTQNELNNAREELAHSKLELLKKQDELNAKKRATPIIEIERKFLFGEKPSLLDAYKLINTKYPEIIFGDDIESQLTECAYEGSSKLLKFLCLLVDDYLKAINSGQPDSQARNILGQTYRANESEVVLGDPKLKRQRMFKVNGELKLFTKHLSIATGRNPRNSCSIYFDIENSIMTIGYIGGHLDNTLT